jgi:hypothetical protein
MSQDPFNASIQCVFLVAMVISGVVYLTGWGIEGSSGQMAVAGAIIWGVTITGQLLVLAVALWMLLGLFK